MRISDWSSDVCSSDLSRAACNPESPVFQTVWRTVPKVHPYASGRNDHGADLQADERFDKAVAIDRGAGERVEMVKHGFERIADGGLVPVEMAAEEVQMKGWLHLENPLGRLFDGETGEEVHDCAEPLDRIGYVPSYRAHPIFEIDADKFAYGRQHFLPRGEIAIERAARYAAGVADVPHRQSPRPHFADRAQGPVQVLQDASGMVALDAFFMQIGWGQQLHDCASSSSRLCGTLTYPGRCCPPSTLMSSPLTKLAMSEARTTTTGPM